MIDHMLCHKTSLGKFKEIEIIASIFSDHSTVRLEINYKKNKQTNKQKKMAPVILATWYSCPCVVLSCTQ